MLWCMLWCMLLKMFFLMYVFLRVHPVPLLLIIARQFFFFFNFIYKSTNHTLWFNKKKQKLLCKLLKFCRFQIIHTISCTILHTFKKKSCVALTQLSLIVHYSRRIFYYIIITFIFNLYFLCFVVDELPASIIIVYNF